MRLITDLEIVDVWQASLACRPAERALALLAIADLEAPMDELTACSIGQRDARLLTLREDLFGRQLAGLATCPACRERLELSLETTAMRQPVVEPLQTYVLRVGEYDITFRLPNSMDLLEAADDANVIAARARLLSSCILATKREGETIAADIVRSEVLEAVVERMAKIDPQALLRIALCCPACAHEWEERFDIASFLWEEISARAQRALSDVHTLASAYGWPESEVLSMKPARRQLYVELIGA